LKLGTYKKTHFSTNHSAVFTHDHQTAEFRQTTVWTTVVDWPLPAIPALCVGLCSWAYKPKHTYVVNMVIECTTILHI